MAVMKRRIAMLLCLILVVFTASACEKTADEKEDEAAKAAVLEPGEYTLQGVKRDVPGDFTITIYDDGTFQYYETPISSYMGMGHFSVKKDVVTLKDDGGGCTGDINYYRIADGRLLFISEGSANYHFVPLEDGVAFVRTPEASSQ